ncbi:hypothetical protein CIPAW_11G047600 [Carya illinoinensis]|uniref:Uncharacterized protein n=1 Tax=Carya illinoinensis TaxID=32201 RepID=A0A8T1P190_CARIL|nr:hypothetical protein CIPAW_11G047600 [Carya illinoinensis]
MNLAAHESAQYKLQICYNFSLINLSRILSYKANEWRWRFQHNNRGFRKTKCLASG